MTIQKAYKQLIDATWVTEYEVPDDNINKTRKAIGENLEAIIHAHYRDDGQYQGGTNNPDWPRFHFKEEKGRIVKELTITYLGDFHKGDERVTTYRVRNPQNIFSYKRE